MKNNVRKYLNQKNLTQKELAKNVNVSEKTIGNIVSGINEPKVSLALRIAERLGVDVKLLFIIPIVALMVGIYFYKPVNKTPEKTTFEWVVSAHKEGFTWLINEKNATTWTKQ